MRLLSRPVLRVPALLLVVLLVLYSVFWFVLGIKISSPSAIKETLSKIISFQATEQKTPDKPHIIYILADDMGFNDVGYHNPSIKTPFIDQLAREGVRLENYYVQPICSPTRSQLLSGRYQIHFGQQHGIMWPAQPMCLPLNEVTIAQKLKQAGYKTRMVGKWHLGHYRKECTPTYRGFDSFYGFLSGGQNYYGHNFSSGFPSEEFRNMSDGYDFWRNEVVDYEARGQYSTLLFGKESEEIIKNHDTEKPLFLYLSFQAVHSPFQVPDSYLKQYEYDELTSRQIVYAMATCMDEAIGNLTRALKEKGMWDNSVIVFSSDNGGSADYGGNNWPLRGWKWSFWEGGIRAVAFVSGPLIKTPGRQSHDLMHVTDWFPTLVSLAGGDTQGTLPLDGVDQWETISSGESSKRTEILHGIDPTEDWHYPVTPYKYCHQGVIRVGSWKLISGCPGNGSWVPDPLTNLKSVVPDKETMEKKLFLFNIKLDPEEKYDLSADMPGKVKELLERLEYYKAGSRPVEYPEPDPKASPIFHNGVWRPWIE